MSEQSEQSSSPLSEGEPPVTRHVPDVAGRVRGEPPATVRPATSLPGEDPLSAGPAVFDEGPLVPVHRDPLAPGPITPDALTPGQVQPDALAPGPIASDPVLSPDGTQESAPAALPDLAAAFNALSETEQAQYRAMVTQNITPEAMAMGMADQGRTRAEAQQFLESFFNTKGPEEIAELMHAFDTQKETRPAGEEPEQRSEEELRQEARRIEAEHGPELAELEDEARRMVEHPDEVTEEEKTKVAKIMKKIFGSTSGRVTLGVFKYTSISVGIILLLLISVTALLGSSSKG